MIFILTTQVKGYSKLIYLFIYLDYFVVGFSKLPDYEYIEGVPKHYLKYN